MTWNLHIVKRPEAVGHAPDMQSTDVRTWQDVDGTIMAYSASQDGTHWLHFPDFAHYCFHQDSQQVQVIVQEDTPVELVWDNYYRSVLPLALQVHGMEVLHASAVELKRGILAFCGTSESGKSTLAYGFAKRGYSICSDDGVPLEISEQQVFSLPLPFRVRLRPASYTYFSPNPNEDALAFDPTSFESPLAPRRPVLALCVLARTPPAADQPAVELLRLSATEAFRAVLPHAYCFNPDDKGRKRQMIEHYFQIASQVPVYSLRYQTGLEHLARIFDRLEREFL
jgi:hypothetical protein